jgi:serine/threonine protein kinase
MTKRKIIDERFEIGGVIKQGGMATVYVGTDILTKQSVAIKLLKPGAIATDPDVAARFLREGEALRRLNHPNIVKVLATIEEDEQHYVVMDYISGGDLRDLIERHRMKNEPMPIKRVLEIALDLADALSRAHRLKIVHRDIKPANVLLGTNGSPYLTDFGVAFYGDLARVTRTGMTVGTLNYMSPESCAGEALDGRADIWSFGVMLYEMLTLRRPFEASDTADLLQSITRKTPESLAILRPDAPLALVSLVEGMLTKEPELRISSVRLIGVLLESVMSDPELTTGPPPNVAQEEITKIVPPVVRKKGVTNKIGGRETKIISDDSGAFPNDQEVKTQIIDSTAGDTKIVAQESRKVRLRVVMPDNVEAVYDHISPYLLIGRSAVSGGNVDIDMSPYDAGVLGVSRLHAQIAPDNEHGLVLKDLQSTNGTMLNDVPIAPNTPYPLQDGDYIKVGNLKIQVFIEHPE